MPGHKTGPRRSHSIDDYLRHTRVMAVIALVALAAGITSDSMEGRFWARHPLLAGLVASVIVVMLTVAVINEVLERRSRQRWSVLAQYVMLELVRNARLIWTAVLEHAGLLAPDAVRPESVEINSLVARDTPRLTTAVRDVVTDSTRLHQLHEEIALLAAHTDQLVGRYAALMLNADAYAELIDRHVELAGDINWLTSLLDNSDPPDDRHRQRRARSSPAVQIEGQITGDQLAERIVVITQLAEELDRSTLQLALRVVPVEWWQARLGTDVPPERQTVSVPESR
jgi:hypothetical protein